MQLVDVQGVSAGCLLEAVLLPVGEHGRALQPGHPAVWVRRFTGQDGLVSFKDLLIFQLLLEENWGSCQRDSSDNKWK